METTLLAGGALSKLIVIKLIPGESNEGCAYRRDDGFVGLGEESVFSTGVKIEAERATSNDRYVHLRFCHSNKYWARKANDRFIVAESNQPEEDTKSSSCTLFEVVMVDYDNGLFYLNHVQSQDRLLFDNATMRFFAQPVVYRWLGILSYVNWDALVKLPKHVAFKGFNGSYLQAVWWDDHPYLQFAADDPNRPKTSYQITQLPDGHVRIFSNIFSKYWRRDDTIMQSGWIWADSDDATANKRNTLFWPVKIDDNTIALRSADSNNFCQALNADGKTDCLDAAAPTIFKEARLGVQELVLGRRIYNVRYWMENSRIFNEKPFVAGATTAFNHADSEAVIAVEVSYEDSKSYSFTRSTSVTAGVTGTIEFGMPLIEKGIISLSFETTRGLEWNNTTTTTTSIKATGTVTVPPRTVATVNYVGTMGAYEVPFSYTKQDKSSTDGRIIESEEIDGVFRGVNAYNFSFVVEKTQPL